jgi:inositol-phosphate transport system permease protein
MTEKKNNIETRELNSFQSFHDDSVFVFDRRAIIKTRRKEQLFKFSIYSFLIIISLPIFIGYAWLFIASFSNKMPVGLLPRGGLTLNHWRFLWQSPDLNQTMPIVWPVFFNTLYLGLGTALVTLIVSVPAGYALSRLMLPARKTFLAVTLMLHAFPGICLLIALYWVLDVLHMLNSLFGVILVNSGLMSPFSIWVMKGFFDGISWDIEMSALIDGASRWQVFYKIMIPQVLPGIFAISIFTFIMGWSSFIYVIVFILDKQGWTLASYCYAALGDLGFMDFGLLAASAVFYTLPVILFFIFGNKYLMKVTVGGLKGGG